MEVRAGQAVGLEGTGYVMCDQVRTVSRERLRRRGAEQVATAVLEDVEDRLRILMGL